MLNTVTTSNTGETPTNIYDVLIELIQARRESVRNAATIPLEDINADIDRCLYIVEDMESVTREEEEED